MTIAPSRPSVQLPSPTDGLILVTEARRRKRRRWIVTCAVLVAGAGTTGAFPLGIDGVVLAARHGRSLTGEASEATRAAPTRAHARMWHFGN